MSVETEFDPSRGALTLRLPERFEFSLHREFRDAYLKQEPAARSYVIDLAAVSSMDSAALGMLLLLREQAGGEHAEIHLVNASPAIRTLLQTAQFPRLFQVH